MITQWETIVKKHSPSPMGLAQSKKSAVCIPLIKTADSYDIIFEVRSPKIKHQPGDICFPGGMMEEGETPEETAVREICEELLITPEQVSVMGASDYLLGNSLTIYPFAVTLTDYHNTFSTDEVSRIIRVPLDFFLEQEPEIYRVDRPFLPSDDFPYDRIVGGRNYQWRKHREEIYFYQYKEHCIWGLTARILYGFVHMLKEEA